jgi:hypothetical protein
MFATTSLVTNGGGFTWLDTQSDTRSDESFNATLPLTTSGGDTTYIWPTMIVYAHIPRKGNINCAKRST